MKTFRIFVKGRDGYLTVDGDNVELDNVSLRIKDAQGNIVASFWSHEVQGWTVVTTVPQRG